MLEFVHLSGSEAGKDLQTRRKVRSQAMRDFRRRQRAEREAATKSTVPESLPAKKGVSKTRPTERTVPRVSIPSKDSADTVASRGCTTAPGESPLSRAVSTPSFSRQLPTIIVPSHNKSISNSAVSDRSEPLAIRTSAKRIQTRPQQSPQSKSSVSTSPGSWCAEMEDPFQSPAQLNEMSAFCRSYIDWLSPDVDSELVESVLSNAWEVSQCPMLLAACCLASVGHLDAIQPDRPNGNHALYKARILQEVSERMQSPATATSDEVIGTLACLLSFELSQGSSEALTHLRGLRSIIKMRGGMDTLTSTNLLSMLEMLDLLHAAIFNHEPVLVESPPDQTSRPSDSEAFSRFTPLLLAEQEAIVHADLPFRTNFRIFADFLQIAAHFLGNSSQHESAGRLQHLLEQLSIASRNDRPTTDDSYHLAQACSSTLAILYGLVVRKTPHRHQSNEQHVQWLFTAIQNTSQRHWMHVPYLQLFVLLTGAVTSNVSTTTSYFKAQIIRVIYQMGPSESRRIRDFLQKHLQMKQTLERPTRRATPPLEISQPISTDAAYLYAGWPEARRSSSLRSRATSVGSTQYSTSLSGDRSPMIFAEPEPTEITPVPSLPLPYGMNPQPFVSPEIVNRSAGPRGSYQQPTYTRPSDRAFHDGGKFNNAFWPTGVECW